MFDSKPDKIISRVGRRDSSSGGDEKNLFKTFAELLQETSNNHIVLKLSY